MPQIQTSVSPPLRWLVQHSRPFLVNGKNVEILYSPDKFFQTLKEGITGAKKRVLFSSLYLGTGPKETELVECLRQTLSSSSHDGPRCAILLDHLRGSRGQPNSRTMLQDLVSRYGTEERFRLGLYHTPNLRGLLRALGPERFNEVMGLQHMKIYLFDDSLVLSGANLSEDYFVNRQDRYVLFKDCKELADHFAAVLHTTLAHSFTLNTDGSTTRPSALTSDPLSSRHAASAFKTSLASAMEELVAPCPRQSLDMSSKPDTVVFPLLQVGFCGIRQDEVVTRELLSSLGASDTLYLASGYFNLPPAYSKAILRGQGKFHVLAASPQANGFYGARGVAGHVPVMYMHFARKFLGGVVRSGREEEVSYWEYGRPGWTFHGKGVWHYPEGRQWPVATLVGSSNYGHRSLTRDLEAQVAVITVNPDLQMALHKEKEMMFEHAKELSHEQASTDPSRKLNLWERIATTLLQKHV